MKRPAHLVLYSVLALVLAALPAMAQTNGFVLAEGPGKLVDSLVAAGYGNMNLYQTLVQIDKDTNPSVMGVLTPTFLQTLKACPVNSTIFTTQLSSYAGSGVVINANGTAASVGNLQASSYNGLVGTATLATDISGVGHAVVVSSTTAAPVEVLATDGSRNYTTCSVSNPGPTCITVFAMIYAPQGSSQNFVLSDEAPGHLIASMVAAGYGDYYLYETLVAIRNDTNPSIAGVLTSAFLNNLARNCAVGSQIFTIQLKNVTGPAVAVSDDCSVQSRNLQGSTFNGQPGTTTLAANFSGVGSASLVSSTSSNPVTSWTQSIAVGTGTATVTYNAFAILYTPGGMKGVYLPVVMKSSPPP